jgi:hypothetical protein
MPCIFCTCVFLALVGQVSAAVVEQLEQLLQKQASGLYARHPTPIQWPCSSSRSRRRPRTCQLPSRS